MIRFLVLFLGTLHFAISQDFSFNIANLDEQCLRCLCIAATGCNMTYNCGGGYCGPYRISQTYWDDAGKVVMESDTPQRGKEAYEDCALNYQCAQRMIRGYMLRYARDCNNDGITDCDDYALINFNGGIVCDRDLNRNEFGRSYLERYLVCQNSKLILSKPAQALSIDTGPSKEVQSATTENRAPYTLDLETEVRKSNPTSNTSTSYISNNCLGCLCEASSHCNKTKDCTGDTCGPFNIKLNYWISSGKGSEENIKDYLKCSRDVYCAGDTVRQYISKFRKDCNNDGIIDCDDHALLHQYGSELCTRYTLSDPYGVRYKTCKNIIKKL